MRKVVLLGVLVLAGCGGTVRVDPPALIRPPDAKTDMDTNPANLASAVITAGLHQLPVYIDGGGFRLLPFDLQQASVPGKTLVAHYRVTMPRTHAVVDTVAVAAPTAPETHEIASHFRVRATFDGTTLDLRQHWVFYRNNGPQICRIYFPGDLGSLQMGANSFVLNPLRAGEHVLRVEVEQRVESALPPARIVRVYRLRVLPRGVGARERAIAPKDESTPAPNNVPLVLRQPGA